MDRVLRMMDAQLTEGGVLRHGMGLHGRHTGALNTDYRVAVPEQVRVITSEQSNTSVILRPEHTDDQDSALRGDAVIVKFFRVVGEGRNPDVEVGVQLTSHGSSAVPATAGWIDAQWRQGLVTTSGQLAVAAQFLEDSQDAWAMAVAAATEGRDFTALAEQLGVTTARVHADLLAAFEPATVDDAARRRFLDDLAARVRWAWQTCGEQFEDHRPELEALLAELAETREIPALQRIHGDYHLGQVLHSPDRGWLLLDFEGEPLRPLAERTQPDSAFRDIAGMVRSLDYAGGSVEQEDPTADARTWVDNGVNAFLAGYTEHATDPREHDALLRAFLLDKALFEVIYEARNRPTWLAIPVAAIDRQLGLAPQSEPSPERGSSA